MVRGSLEEVTAELRLEGRGCLNLDIPPPQPDVDASRMWDRRLPL